MDLLSVSDAAAELSRLTGEQILPRRLTEWLYLRRLPADDFPLIGGRRLIPRNALPQLAEMISERNSPASEGLGDG